MPNLEYEITHPDSEVAIVTPRGELDLSGAAVLEPELERLVDEPGLTTLVLDLSRLDFMDSSGLRLVVVASTRAREAGRRFVLVRGDEQVHRVFEITRMAERLEFIAHDDELLGEPS
jgi:anti-anti-sigma factor